MAFTTDINNEEENPRGGAAVNNGGGSLIGSGGGTVNADQATSAKTGTGFANLQAYLDANQGQTGQMADNVVGQLGQERSDFQNTINDANTNFQNTVSQNNPTDVNAAWANPMLNSGFQGNDNYQSILNNEYRGPGDFTQTQDFQGLNSAYGDLQDRSNLLGSEAGRSGVLNEMSGPGATRGGNSLDQFLLQNDAGAREKLGGFQEQVAGDQALIDNAVSDNSAFVTSTQDTLSQSSQELADMLAQMEQDRSKGATGNGSESYGSFDPGTGKNPWGKYL